MTLRVRARLPGDEPPRPAHWELAAAGVAVGVLWATIAILTDACEPPGYMRHYLELHGGSYAYPTHEVIVGLSLLYTEAIVLVALLRVRAGVSMWSRCALLGMLITPWFVAGLAGTAVTSAIGVYQLIAGGWLLCIAAVLAIAGIIKYVRVRRTSGY